MIPISQIYILGGLVGIVFGKANLVRAARIPIDWIDYWLTNGLSHIVIGVGLVTVIGVCGVLIRNRWIVIVSSVALALFWLWFFSLTNVFLIFGAPGSGG